MMGSRHALSGAAVGAATAPLLDPVVHLTPVTYAVFVAVCAGAAMFPDIDHPDSEVSRTFGLATRAFSWVAQKVAGGHRNGTHSFLGVAIFTQVAFGVTALHTGNFGAFLVGTAVALMIGAVGYLIGSPDEGKQPAYDEPWKARAAATVGIAVTAALATGALLWPGVTGTVGTGVIVCVMLAAGIRVLRIKGWADDIAAIPITIVLIVYDVDLSVVPYAFTLGTALHIAGDMITKGGCPLGWPWSQKMWGPKVIKTNGWAEKGPIKFTLLAVLIAAIAWNSGLAQFVLAGRA